MKISIFTPSNNLTFLNDAYDSFKNQDFFEWVLLFNNISTPTDAKKYPFLKDKRVKIFNLPKINNDYNIGFLKNLTCGVATGDILVELDHDDLLTEDAISEIKNAFKDPEVGFVYSNTANFSDNFQATPKYDETIGWVHRKIGINDIIEHVAWEPSPFVLDRIWFAPNHVRAWRTTVYKKIGGHNWSFKILDDQELIMRTYIQTKFKHIDKCLYLYRITGKNNWLKYNKEIQSQTGKLHNKFYCCFFIGCWVPGRSG